MQLREKSLRSIGRCRSGVYAWREVCAWARWNIIYSSGCTPEDRGPLLRYWFGLEVTGGVVFSRRLQGVRGFGCVGSGSSLHDAFLDARGGLYIGNNVMFGNEVMVLTAGHSYKRGDDRAPVTKAPITIGDEVWIGSRATILAGVTIGTGAVIGAGSVVTRDVEPWSLAAGVPARFIRLV